MIHDPWFPTDHLGMIATNITTPEMAARHHNNNPSDVMPRTTIKIIREDEVFPNWCPRVVFLVGNYYGTTVGSPFMHRAPSGCHASVLHALRAER